MIELLPISRLYTTFMVLLVSMFSRKPFGSYDSPKPFWKRPLILAHIAAVGGLATYALTNAESEPSQQEKNIPRQIECQQDALLIDNRVVAEKSYFCDGDRLLVPKLERK